MLFLRLGATSFGGPAAHIAMLRDEVVMRRRWLTDGDFVDLLALPTSSPARIRRRWRSTSAAGAGWGGLLFAGVSFIAPAAVMVGLLAMLYVKCAATPDARAVMSGVMPVVLAIVAHASIAIGIATLRGTFAWFVAIATAALAVGGFNELALLLIAGLSSIAAQRTRLMPVFAATASVLNAQAAQPDAAAVPLAGLSLFFLKVGSVLFGSGYG